MISVVVFGCGAVFSSFYLDALSNLIKMKKIEVVEIVDPGLVGHSVTLGHKKHLVVDQVSDVEFDSALILSPPSTHAELCRSIVSRCRAVLIEKPSFPDLGEFLEVSSLFKSAGVSCYVSYPRRYFRGYKVAVELIKCLKQRSQLFSIHVSDCEVFRWPIQSSGIFECKTFGGVVWDKGPHNFEFLTSCLPDIKLETCQQKGVKGVCNDLDCSLEDGDTNVSVSISWRSSYGSFLIVESAFGRFVLDVCSDGVPLSELAFRGLDFSDIESVALTYKDAVRVQLNEFLFDPDSGCLKSLDQDLSTISILSELSENIYEN